MSHLRGLVLAMGATAVLGCPLGLGDRCAAEGECRSGLVCRTVPDAGAGACDYPPGAAGTRCSSAAFCDGALTCSNHFTPGERYGECVARREPGEACFVGRDCLSGKCLGASGAAADGQCG